jgi:hypothetical protein
MIRINPHWKRFKAYAIETLGYDEAANVMRFIAQSMRNVGPEGSAEHFDWAAQQLEMEKKRAEAA